MAITTLFGGIEYRSRLEAKWGAFFAHLGWHFTYEPFDGNGYIPDFAINGDRPLLIEVKPAVTLSEYRNPIDKMVRGVEESWQHDLLIVGTDPLPPLLVSEFFPRFPGAGVIGQNLNNFGGKPDWDFEIATWVTCLECNQPAVIHPVHDFTTAPCGHHDGDHHLGAPDVLRIRRAWADATNDVKWRGRAA